MFHPGRAALFSIQLSLMCHVLADVFLGDHRDVLVNRGETEVLTCNDVDVDVFQIEWRRSNFLFSYQINQNRNFSNFTLPNVRIDSGFPSNLTISNAQQEDEGNYSCTISHQRGVKTITWNLKLPEEERPNHRKFQLELLIPVFLVLLLCGVITAVCLYRKFHTGLSNQDQVQAQSPPQSRAEVRLRKAQQETDRRSNNAQRSQYLERLNSIYNH